MAIIALRAYNREIEGMIDNGQLDESVAHCRHILATFPKHIATYRLLGKAHLEQQRISDATDIFQRVLSAIPDDFISNVGMSIIREDENNLDAAIWHMELAYEAQPANLAIQDELRRLYGRRDGMQPPRVRLTRGALARMYAKGGLFDQAVAELRAAITEDPNRPDLQLLLAQMLYQIGQRVDAVDTCVNILKKIPLCLEANRILAISLPDSESSELVRNSRQLVVSMDPYFAFAEPETISSDQVTDNTVTIERLEYKSGIQAAEVPEQPAWATSLGISMDQTAEENVPDWLKAVEAPIAAAAMEKSSPGVSPFIWDTQEVEKIITDTSKTEGEIPDWMKDAGWQSSTGEAQPIPPELTPPEELTADSAVNNDLAQADIPEWLRGIAPDGFMGVQGQQMQSDEEKLSNPWLEPHQPGPTDSIIHWLDQEKPVAAAAAAQKANIVLPPEDEMPDWLKDIDVPQPAEKESTNLIAPAAAFTAGLAAFLNDEDKPAETQAGAAPAGQPEAPSVEQQLEAAAAVAPGVVASETAATPSAEEEMPDWLKDMSSQPAAAEGLISPQPELPVEGAEAPEEIPTAQAPAEAQAGSHLPELAGAFLAADMISKAADEPAEEQPVVAEPPAEGLPTAVAAAAAIGISGESPSPLEAEISSPDPDFANEPEAFAWLKGLADEQDSQADKLVTPGPEGEIPPPEWVKLEMEPETAVPASVESTPPPATPPASTEEAPAWISGLGEETETEQPPVEALPVVLAGVAAAKEEELPAWLTEMEQPETGTEASAAAEEPLEWETEELPAWLKEITDSEQPQAPIPQPALEVPAPPLSGSAQEEPDRTGGIAAAAVAASLINKEEPAEEAVPAEVPQEQVPQPGAEEAMPAEPAQPEAPVIAAAALAAEAREEESPVSTEAPIPAGPQEELEPTDEHVSQAALDNARTAINSGEPSKAIGHYNHLIKKNYHVDEVIKDLQDALYRYPVDPDMWVTLGDAHSQTEDLQEALNAYTKAEELVR